MALTCPLDLDVAGLRAEVQTMYSRVAASPNGDFHFHRGPEYAATKLGYDTRELAALPSDVTASFAGVGNPHAVDRIERAASCWTSVAVQEQTCSWPRGGPDRTGARLAST